MKDYIDIRTLPKHTKKEVIFGKIKDVVLGRSEGFTVKPNLDYLLLFIIKNVNSYDYYRC